MHSVTFLVRMLVRTLGNSVAGCRDVFAGAGRRVAGRQQHESGNRSDSYKGAHRTSFSRIRSMSSALVLEQAARLESADHNGRQLVSQKSLSCRLILAAVLYRWPRFSSAQPRR